MKKKMLSKQRLNKLDKCLVGQAMWITFISGAINSSKTVLQSNALNHLSVGLRSLFLFRAKESLPQT